MVVVTPVCYISHEKNTFIQVRLQARYAPATANKLLTALRRVLREARRRAQINADDFAAAIDLPVIHAPRLPRGRLVTDAEILALMQVCARDKTPAGARDAAIIGLLRGTGLRRSEAAALDLVDYEPARGGSWCCDGARRRSAAMSCRARMQSPGGQPASYYITTGATP